MDIRRNPGHRRREEVVIIDFKTSDVRTQKDADRRAKESEQLAIYALAYQRHYDRMPDRLELHFLGPRQVLVGSTTPNDAMLAEASESIEAGGGRASGSELHRHPGLLPRLPVLCVSADLPLHGTRGLDRVTLGAVRFIDTVCMASVQ